MLYGSTILVCVPVLNYILKYYCFLYIVFVLFRLLFLDGDYVSVQYSRFLFGLLPDIMYVCMVTHIARVWINRVWLPILPVVR